MTLSAWRPLKDAPFEGTILAKLADGQLKLATATVVTVGFCRHGGDPGWQEAAWVDEGDRQIPDDSIVGWLPIADTYELDRAVQYAVAIAFGQLVALLADGMNCGECCGGGCRASQQALAIEDFGRIVRTAMGGRIPDEVP